MLSRGSFGLGLLPKSGGLDCGEEELVFDLIRADENGNIGF